MKFLKKNIWSICSFAVLFALCSFDANADVMESAASKATAVFKRVKTITFIVGGFGLVGIAYQAIIGKVKWGWFAGLAVGLAILAAAGAVIDYATGESSHTGELTDTFQDNVSM